MRRRLPAQSIGRETLFGYRIGDPQADLSLDDEDNAERMPKCVVIDPAFTWGGDQLLRTPWDRTVIYELHVQGIYRQASGHSRRTCAAPMPDSRRRP